MNRVITSKKLIAKLHEIARVETKFYAVGVENIHGEIGRQR